MTFSIAGMPRELRLCAATGVKMAQQEEERDKTQLRAWCRACGADYAKPLAKSYCDECVRGDVLEQEEC